MLKCDLVTFQSAGRERTLLPDVESAAAVLQIGISAASSSFVTESVSSKLALGARFNSPTV